MAEDATAIGRLKSFIDYLGYSNSQFADKAGIPRPTLSQLVHGRNKSVSDTLLRKLYESFPQLNITWLLFGQGDMLSSSNFEISERQDPQNKAYTDSQISDSQQSEILLPGFDEDYFGVESMIEPLSSAQYSEKNAVRNEIDRLQQPIEPARSASAPEERKRTQADLFNDIVMPLQMPSSSNSESANGNPDVKDGKRIKSIIVLYTDSSFEVFSSDK